MRIEPQRRNRRLGQTPAGFRGFVTGPARGVAAEETVRRMLFRLLHPLRPFHVLRAPAAHGCVNHVVIAPGGVFVVATGAADDGSTTDRDWLDRVSRVATALRHLLGVEGIDQRCVTGVLCLPPASLERAQCVDGVLVARPWQLAFLMRHWRGHVLSDAEIERIAAVLRSRAPRAAAA